MDDVRVGYVVRISDDLILVAIAIGLLCNTGEGISLLHGVVRTGCRLSHVILLVCS